MPGHYGDETVSMLNLTVAKVIPEKHLLLIEGGIPGAKGSMVLVRHAVKTRKRKAGR
jgi:large subunit ribosomal protein L3